MMSMQRPRRGCGQGGRGGGAEVQLWLHRGGIGFHAVAVLVLTSARRV